MITAYHPKPRVARGIPPAEGQALFFPPGLGKDLGSYSVFRVC